MISGFLFEILALMVTHWKRTAMRSFYLSKDLKEMWKKFKRISKLLIQKKQNTIELELIERLYWLALKASFPINQYSASISSRWSRFLRARLYWLLTKFCPIWSLIGMPIRSSSSSILSKPFNGKRSSMKTFRWNFKAKSGWKFSGKFELSERHCHSGRCSRTAFSNYDQTASKLQLEKWLRYWKILNKF